MSRGDPKEQTLRIDLESNKLGNSQIKLYIAIKLYSDRRTSIRRSFRGQGI